MSGRLTDEQLRDWREDSSAYREIVLIIDELLANRAALEKEVPALYGQYDDEGNPLWMDGAVRQLFALRAALEKARGEQAQIDSEAMRAKCEAIAQAEYEKYNAKMQAQPHKAHWSDMADAAGIIADRIAALKGRGSERLMME